MIDLHSHILPDWDDGAADNAESLRMLDAARSDGITGIVLTPHVFRVTSGRDLKGLPGRMRQFLSDVRPDGLQLYPGAEVGYASDLITAVKELGLTINGTSYVFIEFPAQTLPDDAPDLVNRMLRSELIPIISHPERNAVFARRPRALYELIRRGALGQLTGQSLTGAFGKPCRRTAERFLRLGLVHFIASDAHDAEARPPRLSEAVAGAARIVGDQKAEAMVTSAPAAVLANEQIPDFGEPRPRLPRRFRFIGAS